MTHGIDVRIGARRTSGAIFSACGVYRYYLWRELAPDLLHPTRRGTWLYVMLNPSDADHEQNDPTVQRCISRASDAGAARVIVCNVFAHISTDPRALPTQADPVGPLNDAYLLGAAAEADHIICAWGKWGALHARGHAVADFLLAAGRRLHAFRANADGTPAHPLYLPYALEASAWRPTAAPVAVSAGNRRNGSMNRVNRKPRRQKAQ